MTCVPLELPARPIPLPVVGAALKDAKRPQAPAVWEKLVASANFPQSAMNSRPISLILAGVLLVQAACASGRRGDAGIEPLPTRPLAGLAAQPLVVFPVHYLRTGDSIGWSTKVPNARAFLASFDSTLEAVLTARGITSGWRFAPALARTAQLNRGYLADPYQLAAQGLRPPSRPPRDQIRDPLISQLRAWVAMTDSRAALLPVELRFEGTSDSAQAVLRLALIDARLAQLTWMADVRSDFGPAPNAQLILSLARNVADLTLPP